VGRWGADGTGGIQRKNIDMHTAMSDDVPANTRHQPSPNARESGAGDISGRKENLGASRAASGGVAGCRGEGRGLRRSLPGAPSPLLRHKPPSLFPSLGHLHSPVHSQLRQSSQPSSPASPPSDLAVPVAAPAARRRGCEEA
jgi:hypothetical protein